MQGQLLATDGSIVPADRAGITAAIATAQDFWLDISDLEADGSALLGELFKIHPLAIEDAEHFGQRPKLDEYDTFIYLVVHGASEDSAGTVEVHCIYAEHYLVTVRHGACTPIDRVLERESRRGEPDGLSTVVLLYRVVDALVDSFFPVLERFDDEIDDLEDAILVKPTEAQLGSLFDMKRSLVALRKAVTPQRDMFATFAGGATAIPGMTRDAERYFRDVYDHLIRISDLLDSYRDLLAGAMDTHLSTVSNRLNEVMKQLTIIATIFLPLSFLTGFFGQNFAWMVNHLVSPVAFFGFAVGLEVVAAIGLLSVFRRRGWL